MFLTSYLKPRSTIGLEIGPGELRLVKLSKHLSKINIDKVGVAAFSPQVISREKINQVREVTDCLGQLVSQLQLEHSSLAVALPGHVVISKLIVLPGGLNEAACEAEITDRLNHYFLGIEEALYVDFVMLEKHQEDSQEVLLFAARQSIVDAYIDIVMQVGCSVVRVDIDSYALARAVQWCVPMHSRYRGVIFFSEAAQFFLIDEKHVVLSCVLSQGADSLVHYMQQITALLQMRGIAMSQIDQIIIAGDVPLNDVVWDAGIPINQLDLSMLTHSVDSVFLQQMSSRLLVSMGLALRGLAI